VPTFWIALALSLLGGLGGLAIASSVLLFTDNARKKLVPWLISYAVGALLGIAMLGLLPSALDSLPAQHVFTALLLGILLFFILEKLVLWRHCHTHDCEVHGTGVASVIVGDAFHNFVDALAVAAHEIPQEVGDFAILLHAGYSRRKALGLNVLSALASALGAVAAFVAVDGVPHILPYLLVLAASSFLYVAMADLIPDLHKGRTDASSLRQIILIGLGILTVVLFSD
jgi:zinc and cadmium transporter